MASTCGGVKRSNMPSGSNRTGRRTPKTPGSNEVGEDTARIGISNCRCDPACTASRMRRQRIHHAPVIPRNPSAQPAKSISGRGLAVSGGAPAPGNRRGRKWPAHFVHHDRYIGLGCLRNRPPSDMSAQRDEHRERNEKFARCREPNPMAYSCVIISQR